MCGQCCPGKQGPVLRCGGAPPTLPWDGLITSLLLGQKTFGSCVIPGSPHAPLTPSLWSWLTSAHGSLWGREAEQGACAGLPRVGDKAGSA